MIEIQNLNLRFGEKVIFKDWNARFPDAGVVQIAGASGRGKTTLLRVLAGLQKADTGRVTGLEERRIGFVFQEDRLLPWRTALENLTCVTDGQNATALLNALGLGDAAGKLPRELSGGMARRVALARALAYTNDVLFLDEPFTGLDRDAAEKAADCIRKRAQLILLVTHDEADQTLLNPDTKLEI